MTLDDVLRDIHAMREDILVFERKYGIPTEIFYVAYQEGEEPADSTWVLDWSQWAGSYEILQERLTWYRRSVEQLPIRTTNTCRRTSSITACPRRASASHSPTCPF